MASQAASCHSKGRGGGRAVPGPLRLPWGGVGPLARLLSKVSGRKPVGADLSALAGWPDYFVQSHYRPLRDGRIILLISIIWPLRQRWYTHIQQIFCCSS